MKSPAHSPEEGNALTSQSFVCEAEARITRRKVYRAIAGFFAIGGTGKGILSALQEEERPRRRQPEEQEEPGKMDTVMTVLAVLAGGAYLLNEWWDRRRAMAHLAAMVNSPNESKKVRTAFQAAAREHPELMPQLEEVAVKLGLQPQGLLRKS